MKLKAFTIVEIIVAMIISTFIIMIVMMVYFVLNTQFLIYKQLNEEVQKIYELHFLLQKDFDEAEAVYFNKDSNIMTLIGKKETKYQIYDSLIVRNSKSVSDTFAIHAYQFDCFYNEPNNFNLPIQSFKLETELSLSGKNWLFCVRSPYSAKSLIEVDNQGVVLD
ncbi:MAG: hypothetical protein R2764_23095 [Bacteroidales bacterium]